VVDSPVTASNAIPPTGGTAVGWEGTGKHNGAGTATLYVIAICA
jgi:hypothetical protein